MSEKFEGGIPPQEQKEKQSMVVEVHNDSRAPHAVTGDIIWHEGKRVKLTKKIKASPGRFVSGNRGNEYNHEDHQTWEAIEATPDDELNKWRTGEHGPWMSGAAKDVIRDKSAEELGLHFDSSGRLVREGKVNMRAYKGGNHPDYDVYRKDKEEGKPWTDHHVDTWTDNSDFSDRDEAQKFINQEVKAGRLQHGIVEYRDEQGNLLYSDYVWPEREKNQGDEK